MLETYFRRMDLHALRKDARKSFFDLQGCDGGASSVQALEKNYIFVLELVATMAGAPALPPHGKFKVGPSCLECWCCSISAYRISVMPFTFLVFLRLDVQACFYKLATTYGLFPAHTRKKAIKDTCILSISVCVPNCSYQSYHQILNCFSSGVEICFKKSFS